MFGRKKTATVAPVPAAAPARAAFKGINVRANEHGFEIPVFNKGIRKFKTNTNGLNNDILNNFEYSQSLLIQEASKYGPVSSEEQEYYEELDRRCEAAKKEALSDPTRHEYVIRACRLANPDRALARIKYIGSGYKPYYEDPTPVVEPTTPPLPPLTNSKRKIYGSMSNSKRRLFGLEGGRRKTRKSKKSRRN